MRKQVRLLGDCLGLRDWTFNLSYDPPSRDDALASVECTYGRRIATIWFCTDWWERDPHERHHVLVHELVHIITDPLKTYLGETLPSLVGSPAASAVYEAVRQHEEHAVDQLATALAPHLAVMVDPA